MTHYPEDRPVADRRGRVAIIALTIAGLFFAAQPDARAYNGDGQLYTETKLAQAWWASQGVTGCDVTTAGVASYPGDDAPSAAGWSYLGSCDINIVPKLAEATRDGLRPTRIELVTECAVVAHEVGHALGLGHDAADRFPIMAAVLKLDFGWIIKGNHRRLIVPAAIPRECVQWAGRTVRRNLDDYHATKPARS